MTSFTLWSKNVSLTKRSGGKNVLLLAAFFLIAMLPADAQCSMCRAVLESEADGKTAEGINNGILYLMAIPYLIVGGLFFFIYRKLRHSK